MANQPAEQRHIRIAIIDSTKKGMDCELFHRRVQEENLKLTFYILSSIPQLRLYHNQAKMQAIYILHNTDVTELDKKIETHIPNDKVPRKLITMTEEKIKQDESFLLTVVQDLNDFLKKQKQQPTNAQQLNQITIQQPVPIPQLNQVTNTRSLSYKERSEKLLELFPPIMRAHNSLINNEPLKNCNKFYRHISTYLLRSTFLHGQRSKKRDASVAALITLCVGYNNGTESKEDFFNKVRQIAASVSDSHKSIDFGFFKTKSGLLSAINQALIQCGEQPYVKPRTAASHQPSCFRLSR
jgi:hypothetical protein